MVDVRYYNFEDIIRDYFKTLEWVAINSIVVTDSTLKRLFYIAYGDNKWKILVKKITHRQSSQLAIYHKQVE